MIRAYISTQRLFVKEVTRRSYSSKNLEISFRDILKRKYKQPQFPKTYRYPSQMSDPGPLVWIDCEMTGLDPDHDQIIEICCLLTDGNLDIIEPNGFEAVIHQPKEVMDTMNEWCVKHHGEVLESTNTAEQVQEQFLEYLKKYVTKERWGVLAGNSIHQDRAFLRLQFPKVVDYLHYRMVDVSTLKEIGYRHNPTLMKNIPAKKYAHTARADIEESINELKWYYENYLIKPKESETLEKPEKSE